jgi:hypothetical protein
MDDLILKYYLSSVIPHPSVACILPPCLPDPDFSWTVFVAHAQIEIMVLIAGKPIKAQKYILGGALEACDDHFLKTCIKAVLENIKGE